MNGKPRLPLGMLFPGQAFRVLETGAYGKLVRVHNGLAFIRYDAERLAVPASLRTMVELGPFPVESVS